MLLKVFDYGLNTAKLEALRHAIEALHARSHGTGSSARLSVSRMHREPADQSETEFVRDVVRFFWSSGIDRLYRGLFEREPMLLLEFCTIRVQETRPDDEYVPWHIDANFYGFTVPLLVAWVPLVDVGVDAPGLEFAQPEQPVDLAVMRRAWQDLKPDERGRSTFDETALSEALGPFSRRAVALKVGGFCAFDQAVPHRTQILPGATKRRIAIEFRMAALDALPIDTDPTRVRGMLISWRDAESRQIRIGYSGQLFPELATR